MSDDLEEYRTLQARVDEFFARVHARYAADMRCGAGCAECCQPGLTLAPVEAEALADHLASLPAAERTRIAERARNAPADRCAALEEDGRCAVYEARPVICRSHGVPMRVPRDPRLPVLPDGDPGLAVCHLNFTARDLATVDPDCVLNLDSIGAMLAVVNARFCDDEQDRLVRVPLCDVLFSAHLP